MPRSFQLYLHNAKSDHSPNNQIAFDPTNILDLGQEVFDVVVDVLQGFEEFVSNFIKYLPELPDEVLTAFINLLTNQLNLPGVASIVQAITGFAGDLTNLGQWFTDLKGLLGNPTGLGTGLPGANPQIANVPLLGAVITYLFDLPTMLLQDAENAINDFLSGDYKNTTGKSTGYQFITNMINFGLKLIGLNSSGGLIGALTGVGTGVGGLFQNPSGNAAGSFYNQITNHLTSSFGPGIGSFASALVSFIQDVLLLGGSLTGGTSPISRLVSMAMPMVNMFLGNPSGGLSQQLTGLLGNPTGNAGGSIVSTLMSGANSVMNNASPALNNIGSIVSGAAQFASSLSGGTSSIPGMLTSLFSMLSNEGNVLTLGTTSPLSIIADISTLLNNPTGDSGGSIFQQLKGFVVNAAAPCIVTPRIGTGTAQLTGLFSNPTGSSTGSAFGMLSSMLAAGPGALLSMFTDLFAGVTSFFTNPTGSSLGSPFGGLLSAVGFNGPSLLSLLFGLASGNLGGLFNLIGSPQSPSLTTKSSSLLKNASNGLATILGLKDTSGLGGMFGSLTAVLTDFMTLFGNPAGLGTGIENVFIKELDQIPILGVVSSLFGGLDKTGSTSLLAQLTGSLGGSGSALGDFGFAVTALPQAIIDNALTGLTGNTSSGGLASSLGNELLNIPSGIINGILNLTGTTTSTDQIQGAVSAQANTVASQASQLAQIQASLGGGNVDSDAFQRTSVGANWTVVTNGSISLSVNNAAKMTGSGTGDLIARKNNVQAATDNMQVGQVLSSAAGATPPFISTTFGWNDLWLRMSNFTTWATATGWRWRIKDDGSWQLDYFLNGTIVMPAVATGKASTSPVSGTALGFVAGVNGNSRVYQATVNGASVMNYTETGTTSQIGSTYRYRGFGGRSESLFLVTVNPGSLSQWTAQG